jgi:uncharacterized membrane protein YvbJ
MITTCPECGGQVSDSAPSCPHCGFTPYRQAPVMSAQQRPIIVREKPGFLDAKANLAGCIWAIVLIPAVIVFALIAAAAC